MHFIAQDNVKKALEMIKRFEDKFETIALFPQSGYRKSVFVKRQVRECVVAKHYQIIYSIKNDTLFIQRVLTGYQDCFRI